MARRSLREARIILTGASSGIGRALALRLAQRGARLLVTGRRVERLEQLTREIKSRCGPDAAVIYVAGDVCDAVHRHALITRAADEFGGLDVLINNAGVGAVGPLAEAKPARLRHIMEVNFFAPVELAREALPWLRKATRPLIVNVSSVLGHRAVPDKAEYCASKFALHGISDAWRAELASDGIDVLIVSPSTTSSEFFDQLLEGQDAGAGRRKAASPDWVAAKIVRAMERGRHEIILSWGGQLLVWLDRLVPSFVDWLLARTRKAPSAHPARPEN